MGNLRFLTVFIFSILFSVIGYGQELLSNGNFESSVAKWKSYCDAAGVAPVDGVGGGVAGLAISASTSSPLAGKSSGIITKDAVNRQGCGIATDFVVAEENKAKVLQIKIPYKITSGTYADDQYKVYVYDVDNAAMIEVAPTFIKNSLITESFKGVFQTSLTGVNYRLIIHNASTSAVASTFKLEASVSTQTTSTGSFATDWETYTAGCSGAWTTNTTWVCKKRLVGDTLEVVATATLSGAPNSAQFTADIPAGFTIDVNKINGQGPAGTSLGSASILDSGTQVYTGSVYYSTLTSVTVTYGAANGAGANTNNGLVNQANPMTFAVNDVVGVKFSVPVVGKTSNTVLSDTYDSRPVGSLISFGGSQNLTSGADTKITLDTVANDPTGMFVLASNHLVVKTSGYYDISGSVGYGGNATNSRTAKIMKNVSTTLSQAVSQAVSGGNGTVVPVSVNNVYLIAGDTLQLNGLQDSGSTLGILNASQFTFLSISKSQAPTTISASEVVAFMAEGASSNAAGSAVVIPFNTPSHDTHQGWNSTNKDYTVPMQGIYKVTCASRLAFAGATVNQYMNTLIRVDGVNKREFVKYLENTGVAALSGIVSYQVQLNAGQKIHCMSDTNLATPTLTTSATHTYLEILRVK